MKTKIYYYLGALIAFIFNHSSAAAQHEPFYGIEPPYTPPTKVDPIPEISEPSIWEKVISGMMTPLFALMIILISLSIGLVIYFKKKNAKKYS